MGGNVDRAGEDGFRGDKNHAAALVSTKRALGWDAARFEGALVVEGTGTSLGLPAQLTWAMHADGRVVEKVSSRLGGARGFDGVRGWTVDHTGLRGPCELADLEHLRLAADVWSGRWLLPGGDVEIHDIREQGGQRVASLRLRGGAGRFRLILDGATHLPRALEPEAGPPWSIRYAQFEGGGFCRAARRIEREEGHLRDVISIVRVERAGDIDAHAPTTADAAVSFDPAHGEEVRCTLAPRGRVPLVYPLVDGREVGPFLLDTGASSLAIDVRVADRLRLPSFGRTWVVTSDGGTGACFRSAAEIRLGPLALRGPVFLELDLDELGRALGVPLAGVAGYDLLARAVIEIGGAPPRVAVRPSGAAAATPSDLRWEPLRFEERRPLIACEVEGGVAPLALDSGSSSTVTLYAEAARAFGIEASSRAAARVRGASGVRGVSQRRLKWLTAGGETFANLRAVLVTERESIGGTPGHYGTIGWGLLKGLDLVLDYPRSRLGLCRRSP